MDSADLCSSQFAALSDDALDDELCQLCSHIYAAEYRLVRAIGEWESRGLCGAYGVKSTAHWLNHKCGIALGAAREKVRVARALPGLPRVAALFARGELSYSKVRAITRVATPDNERYLLHLALHGTASHVERTVSAYRRVERLNDPERLLRQRRDRGLDWHWDDDGMLVVHGRLAPEDGALLIRAIEQLADRIWRDERAARADRDGPEGGDGAAGLDAACHGEVEGDVPRPAAARRADALVRLMEAGVDAEPAAITGGERVQVVLHVPVEPMPQTGTSRHDAPVHGESASGRTSVGTSPPVQRAAAASEPDSLHAGCSRNDSAGTGASCPADSGRHSADEAPAIEPGTAVSWSTARRLACDASRVLMLESAQHGPLSVGRRSRTVPWRIRRALAQRDGGCRFPGCTERRYVDAHHIHHWADGGETSLSNLVLLCRHHHRLVHEEGFDCRRTDDGAVVFSYPDGRRVPAAFPLKRGAYEDLAELHRRAGLAIGPKTCSGGWDGTPFSLGDAVAQLYDATYGPGYSPPPRPTVGNGAVLRSAGSAQR